LKNKASQKTKLALFFWQAVFSFVDFQSGLLSGSPKVILIELCLTRLKVRYKKLKNKASQKTKLALFFWQAVFSFVDFQSGILSGSSQIISLMAG
jgi:Co/Zn/Cd efflux system component